MSLPELSAPRHTTAPRPPCHRSEPELYQQGAHHRPREGVPAVHWHGNDHHERLPHCKIHSGRADGTLCAHHKRIDGGVPARSPQLLHPLAPVLVCPCRTPRVPLMGGRPFRVVCRVAQFGVLAARVREYRAGVRVQRGAAVSFFMKPSTLLYSNRKIQSRWYEYPLVRPCRSRVDG